MNVVLPGWSLIAVALGVVFLIARKRKGGEKR